METPNESEAMSYAQLNKGLTQSGVAVFGGVVMAAVGLLTYRQWSDGVAGAGTLLAIGAGWRLLKLARKAGQVSIDEMED